MIMVKFIKPCEGRITSPFGYRIHPIRNQKEMHWGVDYGNSPNDNSIVAVADGAITYAGVMGGYGNVVMVVHSVDGIVYETVYAHLANIVVKVGQTVNQGKLIGTKGTTGNSTGIHLHFEIHVGGRRSSKYTYAKNPSDYIDKKEEVVIVEEQKLTAAQEKIRQEAIALGITDGKNPFREVNQHYVWNAMLPFARELAELKKKIK